MAIGNLAACIKIMLKHEGGWADHPRDPGGATMKGVTMARYRVTYPNATKTQLRNISDADVQRIYKIDYWDTVRGDLLPFGVDLAVFDYGVNSGPARSIRALQSVLAVRADGLIGAITINAATAANGMTVVKKLCASRLSFVRGLKTFDVFGKGWARRIADIEARGVAMWLSSGAAVSKGAKAVLIDEKEKASATAKKQNQGAAAAGGGGAVVGGGDVAASGDINWLLICGLVVVVGLIAGALALKARQNKERAAAYAAVAAGE